MKKLFFLFTLFVFVLSCHDSQKCPDKFYLPAQLFPVKQEYRVGDTITINSAFHREVLAFNTEGKEVGYFDMAGVEWMPGTGVYRINIDSAESKSILSESIGFVESSQYDYSLTLTSGGTILTGEYNFSNDSFNLEYKLVLLQPGVFFHEFGSSTGIGDSQSFEGKCGDFQVFMNINEGMDNNISLLSESPNSHFNNWILLSPKTRFYDMGGFAFKVVQ